MIVGSICDTSDVDLSTFIREIVSMHLGSIVRWTPTRPSRIEKYGSAGTIALLLKVCKTTLHGEVVRLLLPNSQTILCFSNEISYLYYHPRFSAVLTDPS